MSDKTVYNFDKIISRLGTYTEKYDSRKKFFGNEQADPFWVADMDLPTPDFVIDAIKERLSHPMFGYTTNYDAVFDSIIWWMQNQHNLLLDQKWLSLSPSVVSSIVNTVCSTTNIGDNVVILSPVYGPFFFATKQNDRHVLDFKLDITDGKFSIDFVKLEQVIKEQKPKLLFFCNPHNPGGRVWTKTELSQLVAVCTKYGVKIFCDEIHSDLVFSKNKHIPLFSIDGSSEMGIAAHSIGKTFNTSGLCASWVVIPNKKLRLAFEQQQQKSHSDTVNVLGKIAIQSALCENGVDYKQQLTKYISNNIDMTISKLSKIENLHVMVPEATYLVWCDFTAFGNWPTVMRRLLKDAQVALSGGDFFGPAGKGWFRINCAHSANQLTPAIDRIVKEFSK